MMLLSLLKSNWKKIAIVLATLVLLELVYRGITRVPVSSSTNSTASASSSILVQDASSSASSNASQSVVLDSTTSKVSESSKVRTVVREKFRPDGTIESRETEKVETGKKQKEITASHASQSIALSNQEKTEASASLNLTEQSSSSEQVVFSGSNQAGIGPAVWVTIEGAYAGLSYRILDESLLRSNLSIVVGTRLDALPDLDLAVGGMVSKPVSPGLELGVVGIVKVPVPDAHIGIGISYQF